MDLLPFNSADLYPCHYPFDDLAGKRVCGRAGRSVDRVTNTVRNVENHNEKVCDDSYFYFKNQKKKRIN